MTSNGETTDKVVIAGCSGVGKSVLIGHLLESFPDKIAFSVSHTTRKPRGKEVDGVDYHFRTVEDFKLDVENGKFLEHAEVHGNHYGTSRAAVSNVVKKGQVCLLDVDVQAVEQLHSRDWEGGELGAKPVFIFVAPPSLTVLEERLRSRGTESEESIAVRLGNAHREMEYSQQPGKFDYIIVNDALPDAKSRITSLLVAACSNKNIQFVTDDSGVASTAAAAAVDDKVKQPMCCSLS